MVTTITMNSHKRDIRHVFYISANFNDSAVGAVLRLRFIK